MLRVLCIASCMCLCGPQLIVAAEQTDVNTLTLLDGVAWRTPRTTMRDLRGKTVVILNYVTWCPICNTWSPQMLSQLKAEAEGKPVVVVAVCTDEETVPGPVYMAQKQFIGPNILHAYHPKMNQRIGEDPKWLFTAMIVGPDGEVQWKGRAGTYHNETEGKRFVIAQTVAEMEHLGEFRILTPDMPEEARTLLWPLELGQLLAGRELGQATSRLSSDARTAVEEAMDSFMKHQLAQIQELKDGSVAEQLVAYEKAEMLSKSYPKTEEGRAAKEFWVELKADAKFRRENEALIAYEKVLPQLDSKPAARRVETLNRFAKRFPETHAASLAAQRIEQEQAVRKPPPPEDN